MKIAVFGSTGGIGRHIVEKALEKGYSVNAYARNKDKLHLEDKSLNIFIGQVDNYQQIKNCITDCDVVINALGISMKPGVVDNSSIIAHENIIKAMKELGVTRLIDWSTPTIKSEKDKNSFITIVPGVLAGIFLSNAKKTLVNVANQVLTSDLEWTIVRFMAPKNTPFTGDVKIGYGDTKMSFNISRADIAYFMLEQVESDKYIYEMPIIGS